MRKFFDQKMNDAAEQSGSASCAAMSMSYFSEISRTAIMIMMAVVFSLAGIRPVSIQHGIISIIIGIIVILIVEKETKPASRTE